MSEILYTAEALSTGEGRNGHVRTVDGRVDTDMAVPQEMGGSGEGANPEALFAAGYAACFHSALQLGARERKVDISGSTVGSRVHVNRGADGAFVLSVELEVVIPGVDAETAQAIADRAHEVCPYSNATRGNIDVQVSVGDD